MNFNSSQTQELISSLAKRETVLIPSFNAHPTTADVLVWNMNASCALMGLLRAIQIEVKLGLQMPIAGVLNFCSLPLQQKNAPRILTFLESILLPFVFVLV
jgi:hypothetical protein